MACLVEMKLKGYGYCIIGSVGPTSFYEKCCGATIIPESEPIFLIWPSCLRKSSKVNSWRRILRSGARPAQA